MYIALVVI